MSSVVARNVVDVRVTLGVTTVRIAFGGRPGRVGTPRARRSSGLRGSRSNGAGSPAPSSRARVTASSPYRRRTASAASIARRRRGSSSLNSASCSRSPRFDAVTPEEPDADPAHLRASQLERRPVDRLGQVGRLGQGPLAGDRPERRVADLDGHRAGPDPGGAQPAGDAVGHRQQRPLDDLAVGRVDVERVLVADRLRRVAVVDRVGIDAARSRRRATRRACRTGGPRRPPGAPRGRRSSGPRSRRGRRPSSRRRPTAARSGAARGTPPPRPGGTTTRPSGLRRSDAILATSFVVATPTDTVSPTSARTSSLIRRAIVGPSPNRSADRSRRGTPRRSRSARRAA